MASPDTITNLIDRFNRVIVTYLRNLNIEVSYRRTVRSAEGAGLGLKTQIWCRREADPGEPYLAEPPSQ
jgi:hypothetical protein